MWFPGRAGLGVRVLCLAALVAGAGCAGVGAAGGPRGAPPGTVAVFVLDPAHVPPPPPGLTGALAAAWQAVREGRITEARRHLELAADAGSPPAAALAMEGYLALARGQPSRAQGHFEDALERVPGYAPALYGLGVAAEVAGDGGAARSWYRRALAADAALAQAAAALRILEIREARASLARGEAAEAAGELEAAAEAYGQAVELAPELLGPYLRLAELRRRLGDAGAAADLLRRARARVGDSPSLLRRLGLALQEAGAYGEAYEVLQRLRELQPGDAEVVALAAEARRLYETTSLPEPYRHLPQAPVIHREELAALVALRLAGLGERVEEPLSGVVITDIEGSWAAPYIRRVVEWRVMDVYQNHGFMPRLQVSRQMLAEVAYRVLELLGAAEGAPRPVIADVPREHFYFRQIQAVVGRGILELGPGGSFGLLEPVSGQEAIEAVERLARLARSFDPPGGAG